MSGEIGRGGVRGRDWVLRVLKRVGLGLVGAVVLLVAALMLRALPRGAGVAEVARAPLLSVDSQGVAARLSEAIRIPTITDDRPLAERARPFDELHAFLGRAYPRVHSELQREIIGRYSLLYTWRGSDASLSPILLMGHLDVVPVAPGTEGQWTHSPFSGAIANGEVWGRGALDDKQHVIQILDAVESLLSQKFRPRRTVYLLFGHDEEGSGNSGARQAAAVLHARHVRLHFVLDEGGIIGQDLIAGVKQPIALVKVAEKGYLTLELSVRGVGGHSSAPPRPTPVGILASAIARLEDHPFPARLEGSTRALLESSAGGQPFARRFVLRNLWLFGPLVKMQLARSPATDATIRTTIAPTMLQASPKDNVLPVVARALVNLRILPGDSSSGVISHVRDAIADQRVQLRALTISEPLRTSNSLAEPFALLSRTIREICPDVLVAPFLLSGATDSRHFAALSDNIYGFSTARGGSEILERAHGTNERIRIQDLVTGVRLYVQLLRNATT